MPASTNQTITAPASNTTHSPLSSPPPPSYTPVHHYALNHAQIYWYTCRCANPSIHIDAQEITDPVERVGSNYALDLAGRDNMSRDMLWQVIERHFPDEEGLMEVVRKERWVMEIFNWNGRTV
jgi:hypothetical protein